MDIVPIVVNTIECRYNADLLQHITYSTFVTEAEHKAGFVFTTNTSYPAHTGELWGVYCGEFGENWPRYSGTALYTVGLL